MFQQSASAQNIDPVTGTIVRTRIELDLAIEGEGFFVLKDPESGEEFATRRGDFRCNDQHRLVSLQGFCLRGFTDPIVDDQADYSRWPRACSPRARHRERSDNPLPRRLR